MNYHDRSYCGTLKPAQVDQKVQLAGWVDALRDHGDVTFVHLRDRSGIAQLVFSPEFSPESVCLQAAELKSEFCITVTGRIVKRDAGTRNPHIDTGDIEVIVEALAILSRSDTLPFTISEKAMVATGDGGSGETVSEELRLQYRYLDLRRPTMQDFLIKRHRINALVRDFMNQRGFIDVETPMLTKSTPEGARDYLVPSRVHPQQFYALPQSPQLFKQLLMISGFERYYQIARCFRDEDLRPNRQPEFTQLDIEASFIDEDFIYGLIEELLVKMFAINAIRLPRPFPQMSWQKAMDLTGSDRPDLRFEMFFVEATDIFKETGYAIFRQVLQRGGRIRGITVKQASEQLSKNVLQNEYAKEIVPGFGAKGMTWMRVASGRLESNIVQFFSETEQQRVMDRFEVADGDVLLMIADPSLDVVNTALGRLRIHVADRLGRIPQDAFKPVWITEFPLFEAAADGISSSHHPFTAPDRDDFDPASMEDLLTLRSRSYDIVVNGEELGGGSIRIHDRNIQQKIFTALGLSEEAAREKFGFFLDALDYGTPPHGGLALGMDRVVAMILNTASIRDVTAFPKNRSASCPLTSAPSKVSGEQLRELNLLDSGGREELPGAAEHPDPIDKLAWLSRIGLDDNERPAVTAAVEAARQMADAVLGQAPEESPSVSVLLAASHYRDSEPPRRSDFVETGELFKNAPAIKGDFFKVSSILE